MSTEYDEIDKLLIGLTELDDMVMENTGNPRIIGKVSIDHKVAQRAVKKVRKAIQSHTDKAIRESQNVQEVKTLYGLLKLYDDYEMSNKKDLSGDKIATWQGYKFFRNPITDRIEEITGVRSNEEIEKWLSELNKLIHKEKNNVN